MYRYKNRVSYSQLDRGGTLGVTHVLDVMQDACMFHCQEVGRSCMDLKKEGKAWLVSSWHLIIHHLPEMGDEYMVSTWPYQMKGVFNCQNVLLESMEGEVYACGDSRWFFYDQADNKPIRIPEEEKKYFDVEPACDMPYTSRKLACPEKLQVSQKITVCENYLDTNEHVNNGQYVRLAVNVLPEGFKIGELRAEFRNAAHLGDNLYIKTAQKEDTVTVVFTDKEDTPYFLSEFVRRQE